MITTTTIITVAITMIVVSIFLIITNHLIVTARFLLVANLLTGLFVDDQGLTMGATQRQARVLLVGTGGTQDDIITLLRLTESKHCVCGQHLGRHPGGLLWWLTINMQSQ